ncbi:MAG: UDP-2,3-diacylglucosamine diphosphatase LpxI [Holosporales bacterium]|jgi:DUF1009 family protein|nr:UDP-2,3-diacylglucosamine diphosphatase LpxI [Holosporales bacterium]
MISNLKVCSEDLKKSSVIAVIAGQGNLPNKIIDKLQELKRNYVVVSIEGFGPKEYEIFSIGEIGRILEFLKTSNVSEIVFCGSVKRPSLLSLKLDDVGKQWLRYLGVRAFLGDDALLKGIKKLLANEGLKVISPQNIIETLLSPKGILTDARPTDLDLQDIARGLFVLNTLSKTDIGQSVIVQEGVIIGIEAAEGTNNLIRRCIEFKVSQRGGVLVKTAKLNQDRDLDLPTIGKQTIIEAHKARLVGIAIGAEQSQIIDFEATIKLANKLSLFVLGV